MDLLQAVREQGSIAAAAKSLGMSYRQCGASSKVGQRLNQNLIVWEKGMPAELSEFASKLLWAERQAQARLAAPIESLMAEIERTFAVAFDPQAHLLTLYASHDDALIRLRESTARQALHLDIRFCGSVDAIRALNEGRCEIAGFHTSLNCIPKLVGHHLQAPAQARPPQAHRLCQTHARLVGQSRQPTQCAQLGGCCQWPISVRQPRTGNGYAAAVGRAIVSNQAIKPEQLKGYERQELSHSAVATCIASGQADAGLAIESAALAAGLDFIPLVTENYWLACLKSALDSPPVAALRQHLSGHDWQNTLQAMPGIKPTHRAMCTPCGKSCPGGI
jgi:putative molybdopterin biosynthesis protein